MPIFGAERADSRLKLPHQKGMTMAAKIDKATDQTKIKRECGRFRWQPDNRHPGATGWIVIGPDDVVVAWVSQLQDASKFGTWAEALLLHYLDKTPNVYG